MRGRARLRWAGPAVASPALGGRRGRDRRAVVVRQLVDRRPTARQRRCARRQRRDLLAGHQLGRGVGSLRQRGCLVVRRVEERVAARTPSPAWPPSVASSATGISAATRAGAARNSRSRARQARHVFMCGRSTASCSARRLPVGQRRHQWREAVALDAALDAGQLRRQRLPALGQAAVHLRVGEPGRLADLAVRQPARLQDEAADLLGLEPPQRLGALPESLVALGLLVRGGGVGAALDRLAVTADRRQAVALAAQRERLVLDHRPQPAQELLLARGRRLRQQDLERRAGRRPRRPRGWPRSGGRSPARRTRGAPAAPRPPVRPPPGRAPACAARASASFGEECSTGSPLSATREGRKLRAFYNPHCRERTPGIASRPCVACSLLP